MCVLTARVLTYLCGLRPANILRVLWAKCENRDLLNAAQHAGNKI